MQATEIRILKLEAQVNALAEAWLYLAATLEMETGANLVPMEAALQRRTWPSAPDINGEAQATVQYLCRELAAARAVRDARLRDRLG